MGFFNFAQNDNGVVFQPEQFFVYTASVIAGDNPQWLEEKLTTKIKPLTMTLGTNGRLTTVTLEYELGSQTGSQEHIEDYEDGMLLTGDQVRLVDRYGNELFIGHVLQSDMMWAEGEKLIYTAYGADWRLSQSCVDGQWRRSYNGNRDVWTNFKTDLPVIFNYKGKANRDQTSTVVGDVDEDNPIYLFGEMTNDREYWDAYEALRYVSALHCYNVISWEHTNWSHIKSLIGEIPIGEVRIDCVDSLDAIRQILTPIGFGFWLQPYRSKDRKHELRIFRLHNPPIVKRPNMAKVGDSIDSTRGRSAEVERIRFLRDSHAVKNEIRIIGDYKRKSQILTYQSSSTLTDLMPAWDTAQQYPLDGFVGSNGVVTPRTGDGFATLFQDYETTGALVSFGWNEAGNISTTSTDLAFLCSFQPDQENDSYFMTFRPRPAKSFIATDANGTEVVTQPYVEIGLRKKTTGVWSVVAWTKIRARIWKDYCGFTITEKVFDDKMTPFRPFDKKRPELKDLTRADKGQNYCTLLYNTINSTGDYQLQLRLVCGLESDVCVSNTANKKGSSFNPFTATRSIRKSTSFKEFAAPVTRWALPTGVTGSTRDDGIKIKTYSERVRDRLEDEVGHGTVLLRGISLKYLPGTGIDRTAGRQILFNTDAGGLDSFPIVVGINWYFTVGKTELMLDTPMVRIT
jgi:hypothetical protein